MKLTELFKNRKFTLSFEVFPPKNGTDGESIIRAAEKIADLSPDFMSVTCGAGGSTGNYTAMVAERLTKQHGVTAIAHQTCVNTTKSNVLDNLSIIRESGIENILALRGDKPAGTEHTESDFQYASELVSFIKTNSDLCVGGACYPEGHVESASVAEDIEHLKRKVDCGCDFLTTQMFFDNDILYRFLYKIRDAGITVPIIAGIMPVTNKKQIKRICSLSGTALPQRFVSIVDKFGENSAAMRQAGIIYATEQIIDLYSNGVNNVHIYSMNHPDVAATIQNNLSNIL